MASMVKTDTGSVSTRAVPAEVVQAIKRMRSPVVISHVVPDADALGSMLAVARAWTTEDCRPKVSLPDGSLSQRLAFMQEWADAPVASLEDFTAADGFIAVDTAKKGRCNVGAALKQTEWSAGRSVINIDHHAGNTRFGDINWGVGEASSTYCFSVASGLT